jgi:Mn-dependent DtxR family transcriptional regulator
VDDVRERLDRMDARGSHGAWTHQLLQLIDEQPHVRAPDLAASIGWETAPFKEHVRKLKALGLTISHSPGYELSPRGRAVLDRC